MTRYIVLAAVGIALFGGCGSKADNAATAAAPSGEATAAAIDESPPAAEAVATLASDSAEIATSSAVSIADAPATWTVDKTKSRLEFTGTQTGKAFTGSFSSFDTSIKFDPGDLPASLIEVVIDMASARTGDRQRDDALPSKDWFAVAAFPKAAFRADDIFKTDSGYLARGKLTIRDATKPLALPFTLSIEGDSAVADGTATLVRSDFGVGQGEFATGEWVGLDVKVSFHIEARR